MGIGHFFVQKWFYMNILQLFQSWRDQKEKYPRFNFLFDFFKDIFSVLVVVAGLRAFHACVLWLHKTIPVEENPGGVESYLPLQITKTLVTIFDIVALVSIIINAGFTLAKTVKKQWEEFRDES